MAHCDWQLQICLDNTSTARRNRGAADFYAREGCAMLFISLEIIQALMRLHLRSVTRVKYSCNLPPYGANPVIGRSALVRALPVAA